MEITKELKEQQKAEIKIHLEPDDYKPQVTKRLKEQAKQANIPGFRKGKVPISLVKKMVGMSVLMEELSSQVSESLNQYIESEELSILGEPLPVDQKEEKDFDVNCNIPLDFTFEVGLAPKIDLDYDIAELPPIYQLEVDEEFLNEQIDSLRDRHAEVENPETVAEKDIIYGKLNEVSEEGETVEAGIDKMIALNPMRITKEHAFDPFIGRSLEDTVEIDLHSLVEDPAELNDLLFLEEEDLPKIEGKKLSFTIKKINRTKLAELNQSFFHRALGLPLPEESALEAPVSQEEIISEEDETSVELIEEDQEKEETVSKEDEKGKNEPPVVDTSDSKEEETSVELMEEEDEGENKREQLEEDSSDSEEREESGQEGPLNIETEEEFKEELKKKILSEYQNAGSWLFTKEVKEKMIANHQMELPDEFLKKWLLATSKNKEVTETQIEEEYEQFRESLAWSILTREMEEKNPELVVTDEDVRENMKSMIANMFPGNSDLDQLIEYSMNDQQIINRQVGQMREERLTQFFKEKFQPSDSTITITEFNKLVDDEKEDE